MQNFLGSLRSILVRFFGAAVRKGHTEAGQNGKLVTAQHTQSSLYQKQNVFQSLQVLLDQTAGATFFVSTFIVTMGLARGDSIQSVQQQYRTNFPVIYVNSLKLWPAVQAINFTLIPLQHRVLFVSVVALFWNIYLAWKIESDSNRVLVNADDSKTV